MVLKKFSSFPRNDKFSRLSGLGCYSGLVLPIHCPTLQIYDFRFDAMMPNLAVPSSLAAAHKDDRSQIGQTSRKKFDHRGFSKINSRSGRSFIIFNVLGTGIGIYNRIY